MEDLERDQQQKEAINNKEERNQAKLKNSEKGEQAAPGGGRKGEHGDPNSKAGSEGPYGEGFNYDQIIEGINLNSLLGGSTSAHQEAPVAQAVPQGSRFSQFFSARGGGQPDGGLPGEDGSRRGSLQELHKELGQEGPMIAIPSPNQEERYFAPISPAAQTRTMTNHLMDMIGKGGSAQPPVGRGSGRVQELEEGIRRQLGLGINQPQLAPQGPQAHPQQQGHPYRGHAGPAHLPVKEQVHSQPQEQENMSAFKKLVSFSLQLMCTFTFACNVMPESVSEYMPFRAPSLLCLDTSPCHNVVPLVAQLATLNVVAQALLPYLLSHLLFPRLLRWEEVSSQSREIWSRWGEQQDCMYCTLFGLLTVKRMIS